MTDSTTMSTPASDPAQVVTPPAPNASRRRTLLILGGISVGWKVVVLTVGAALPHWLLTDGIAELPAPHRAYGTASLATARLLWNTPAERMGRVVQQVRVVSVDSAAMAARTSDGPPALASDGCPLEARVRAYTYFAIPYSEARTQCGRGVVEYRMFRLGTRTETRAE